MSTELITFIANIALTLSFVAALIFGIAQTNAAARDRKERLTLETLRNFQTREFAELILFVTRKKFPSNQVEMIALPFEEQLMLVQYSQVIESLGMLVAERQVNIDLVDKTLGSMVITTWEKYKPFFVDIRVSQPDPYLGEYFQWLAEQIEKRMREKPRKPFFETNASS